MYLELEVARTEGSLEPVLGSHSSIGVEVFLPQLVSGKPTVQVNGRVSESFRWQGGWLVIDDMITELEIFDLEEQHSPLRLTIGKD